MSDGQSWIPPGVDVSVPSAARVYDYLLGGAHNFAVDRLMGDKAEQMMPLARSAARLNRAFLRRAVRFMAEQGVRQFLDIGSGIPTVANVHEVAQDVAPECRVVYVDRDPVAVAHGELLVAGNDRVGVLQADMRDPDSILNSHETGRLLDFDQPIGLLLLFMLHWVPTAADPQSLMKRYREALPSGSYLAISHLASEHTIAEARAVTDRMNKVGGGEVIERTHDEVEAFFGDFELVEPGLVKFAEWRPTGPGDISDDPEVNGIAYAGVGRKP
ncbi:S-adenosyl methyltransferase [Lentzea atacamensis]|uniref:S-adenosyl methyltransferase n=2 Tax=Lentzea TaxID=165301 RepID=A0A316IEA0_9PSEU|nr:SAM-dependent methyltransferase [Lentzea atacamensis]PWK91752.1 S-adenosyl methyltransferase [Lentzea atacamensis]RAS63686.1 S-adenosyl methyltransferase [Lentzea atacamensis]